MVPFEVVVVIVDNCVVLEHRIQFVVVEGDVACRLVDRKHFRIFDEFTTSSQMSIHWLVNPGSMFIHSDFHATICLPNVLFSASWTLNLIDDVGFLFQWNYVLRGAEKAQVCCSCNKRRSACSSSGIYETFV